MEDPHASRQAPTAFQQTKSRRCPRLPLPLAQVLLAAGADMEIQDNESTTPVLRAVRKEQMDVARLLMARGAKLDCRDSDGDTVVHYAAW